MTTTTNDERDLLAEAAYQDAKAEEAYRHYTAEGNGERASAQRRGAAAEGSPAPAGAPAGAGDPARFAALVDLPIDEAIDFVVDGLTRTVADFDLPARMTVLDGALDVDEGNRLAREWYDELREKDQPRLLFGLARAYRRLEHRAAAVRAEKDAILDEYARREDRIARQRVFLEQALGSFAEEWLEATGELHRDLPLGVRVQGQRVRPKWEITSEADFLDALNAEDRDEVAPPRPHFLKSNANRWLDQHAGDRAIPGVRRLVPGEDGVPVVTWHVKAEGAS